MIELNRELPMEAVHRKSGRVDIVSKANESKALLVGSGAESYRAYFDKYGQPKDDYCPWMVRNVQSYTDMVVGLGGQSITPDTVSDIIRERTKEYMRDVASKPADTIPIDRALWERVEGLVRGMAASDESYWALNFANRNAYDEARAIVALLPAVEVDGDERLAQIMFDAAYPFINGKRNIAWDCDEVRRGWIVAAKAAREELER